MKRVIWHWTAGTGKANPTDRRAYHEIVEADGTLVMGVHPHSANAPIRQPLDRSTYAAHAGGLNTDSIGIALAGMRNATESPFSPGDHPISLAQIDAMLRRTAELCRQYNIPVSRETTLSHAEVEPTLGVKQRQKWDIKWVPNMSRPGNPVEVGDGLRDRLRLFMREFDRQPLATKPVDVSGTPVRERQTLWGAILALLARIFGGRA